MKDAALIVAFMLVVFTAVSWASAPADVYTARAQATVLQARIDSQATEIAVVTAKLPTPRPCIPQPPYFGSC